MWICFSVSLNIHSSSLLACDYLECVWFSLPFLLLTPFRCFVLSLLMFLQNNKGKDRLKYLLQQTEIFAHFAKGSQSESDKKPRGRLHHTHLLNMSWSFYEQECQCQLFLMVTWLILDFTFIICFSEARSFGQHIYCQHLDLNEIYIAYSYSWCTWLYQNVCIINFSHPLVI